MQEVLAAALLEREYSYSSVARSKVTALSKNTSTFSPYCWSIITSGTTVSTVLHFRAFGGNSKTL
ncbi:hypothetical protein V7S43_012097 [Phytophthora oleae]|uniref:Uncharacterized protein n=1 Tax=Phytophthora oleae TaxID=2107226 RepID=A0ABD3FCE0_9STRA